MPGRPPCAEPRPLSSVLRPLPPDPVPAKRKRRFSGVGDRVCIHCEPGVLTTCERRSLSRCNSRANGDASWAEPLGKTAHRRIPSKGVSWTASPSRFSPPPPVPGLFWFRARVILLPDGPTRPMQRLTGRGQAPTFPPPEPPLLFPDSGADRGFVFRIST